MNKFRSVYLYAKEKYALLAVKKYTTIAGTLVFFLIMSIVPFSFWLSLLIGKLPVNPEEILSLPVFDSVKNVLLYIQKEAENATASASVILVFTTLYSATNLFYQMRKSGEIIYDYRRETQGIKLRIGALILLIVVMVSFVVFLLLFALGSFLFAQLFTKAWEIVADSLLLAVLAFFLVLILNVYICPHKTAVKNFLPGTFLTVGLWAAAIIGFSVYLKIGNMSRLYGALSAIIVFLLWLYILMICFIVGVIFNSERVLQALANHKKTKPHKKRKTAQTVRNEKG